jgi:hypothetical protein
VTTIDRMQGLADLARAVFGNDEPTNNALEEHGERIGSADAQQFIPVFVGLRQLVRWHACGVRHEVVEAIPGQQPMFTFPLRSAEDLEPVTFALDAVGFHVGGVSEGRLRVLASDQLVWRLNNEV